jgi:NADPH:quinone reductase-like Zn-dependent oxidoreductase
VVTALGYGTTDLSVGQRVFGLTDWYRDGTLAEYVAVEARNLARLPGDVDFAVGASITAWQRSASAWATRGRAASHLAWGGGSRRFYGHPTRS